MIAPTLAPMTTEAACLVVRAAQMRGRCTEEFLVEIAVKHAITWSRDVPPGLNPEDLPEVSCYVWCPVLYGAHLVPGLRDVAEFAWVRTVEEILARTQPKES